MRAYLFTSLLVGTVAWSAPTATATNGLHSIISAQTEPFGRLTYSWGFSVYWGERDEIIDGLTPQQQDSAYAAGKSILADIFLGAGFSFTEYLSLNTDIRLLGDVMRTRGLPDGSGGVSIGPSDTRMGLKFNIAKLIRSGAPQFLPFVDFALYPMVSFSSAQERTPVSNVYASDTIFGEACRFNRGGLLRYFGADGFTYGGKVLLTASLPMKPEVNLHLNGGYIVYPDSKCNKYSYGGGVEFLYQGFTPFIEVYTEGRAESDLNDGGTYLTPGLKFATGSAFWSTLLVEIRLAGKDSLHLDEVHHIEKGFGSTPPWRVQLVFSQGLDFVKPPIKKGIIAGKVIDAKTGVGIPAKITFGDFGEVVSTTSDGAYEIELPTGKSKAYAVPLKEGYESSSVITVAVKADQKQIVGFKLEPKEKPISILAGTIREKNTGKPCIAVISFPETDLPETRSDETGAYKVELIPGTYIVKVEKTGYATTSKAVVCKPNETSILDFELVRKFQTGMLVGKVVDASTNYGLKAELSFPGTEQEAIQTDEETGTFRVELPPGTYTVKIKAEGYVAEGVVVTLNAKETVEREFKLFKKGERIVLHGINFATNSAKIKPASYPALDESAALLKEHPTIRVEIAGHTDAVGSEVYNLKLSKQRAEAVRNYLVLHGIETDRLIARGYGENQPIASNETKEGRAKNRRIEFRILEE